MTKERKAYFNWSGGKDSALALYHVLQNKKIDVELLLTTVSAQVNRISMHGVRVELLGMQAKSIGIPIREIRLPETVSMDEYNKIMSQSVSTLVAEEFRHTIFGDIFLEDLRKYREEQLAPFGLQVHFPLWQRNTKELLNEFLDLGFKTIVVCMKASLLDQSFAGRIIDKEFIKDLPSSVDPCGENGEFHTFVFDGPIFKSPVNFLIGEKIYKEYQSPKNSGENNNHDCFSPNPDSQMGFWYCDLIPQKIVL
ncbi:MAG: diphthine--ammonia ligase [Cyclobacteriaceae bacterium]